MSDLKKQALLEFLGDGYLLNEIEEDDYSTFYVCKKEEYKVYTEEYKVYTEEEREEAVTEYIKESLWAFKPSFLAYKTDIPEEVYEQLCDGCESGNNAILRLIEKTCGLYSFVDSAVSADGYGYFLSMYDGEENEVSINDEGLEKRFYIYRQS